MSERPLFLPLDQLPSAELPAGEATAGAAGSRPDPSDKAGALSLPAEAITARGTALRGVVADTVVLLQCPCGAKLCGEPSAVQTQTVAWPYPWRGRVAERVVYLSDTARFIKQHKACTGGRI